LPPGLSFEERQKLREAIDRETRRRLQKANTEAVVRSALCDGPRNREHMIREAVRAGLSFSAIENASKTLRVKRDRRTGLWSLPGDEEAAA
jgi:hypothetical protein